MAVATEQSQLAVVRMPQDSTAEYSELHQDPLGEFLSEESPAGGSNRLIRIEPATWMGAEDDIATALPFGAPPPEPKSRWFVGAMMLCVGLVAGFAVAAALVWHFYGGGIGSLPNVIGGEGAPNRTEVPATPSLPPLTPPADPGTTHEPSAAGMPAAAIPAPDPAAATPSVAIATPAAPAEVMIPGLHVQSQPSGASVYLDGQLISTTPFQLSDIAPGTHTVTIVQPGYREWSASVNIEPGAATRISASLESE